MQAMSISVVWGPNLVWIITEEKIFKKLFVCSLSSSVMMNKWELCQKVKVPVWHATLNTKLVGKLLETFLIESEVDFQKFLPWA